MTDKQTGGVEEEVGSRVACKGCGANSNTRAA